MSKNTVLANDIIDDVEYCGSLVALVSVVGILAYGTIVNPNLMILSAVVMVLWLIILFGVMGARNIVIHFEVKEMNKKDNEDRQERVNNYLAHLEA